MGTIHTDCDEVHMLVKVKSHAFRGDTTPSGNDTV